MDGRALPSDRRTGLVSDDPTTRDKALLSSLVREQGPAGRAKGLWGLISVGCGTVRDRRYRLALRRVSRPAAWLTSPWIELVGVVTRSRAWLARQAALLLSASCSSVRIEIQARLVRTRDVGPCSY